MTINSNRKERRRTYRASLRQKGQTRTWHQTNCSSKFSKRPKAVDYQDRDMERQARVYNNKKVSNQSLQRPVNSKPTKSNLKRSILKLATRTRAPIPASQIHNLVLTQWTRKVLPLKMLALGSSKAKTRIHSQPLILKPSDPNLCSRLSSLTSK